MSENVQLIRGAYDAFARGDVPAVIALLDESVEWEVTDALPHGGSFHGQAGAGEFFKGLAEAWESLELQIDQVLDAGDHVVGEGRAHGELRGTGSASYGFAHMFTVDNGAITRFHEYAAPDSQVLAASRRVHA